MMKPPNKHTNISKVQIIRGADEIFLLIFAIDSSNSLGLIIPTSALGYVESNSRVQQPAIYK